MRTSSPGPKSLVASLAAQAARQLTHAYNQVLSPLGLTVQQFSALSVLFRAPGVSLGIFAQSSGIGKAAAAAMIRRLSAMGLVVCEPHPGDGRLNVIRLTDKARNRVAEGERRIRRLEGAVESALGESNIHALRLALEKLRDLDFGKNEES